MAGSMIARDDSCQRHRRAPGFYAGDTLSVQEVAKAATALERAAWLVRVATSFGVPVLVTEEEPHRHGATDAAVLAALSEDAPVLTKPTFGLAGTPELVDVVHATRRRTATRRGGSTVAASR